jgi:hypothetical protein
MCRNGRGEGEGAQLYGTWIDESKEFVYTPGGMYMLSVMTVALFELHPTQVSKEKKGKVVDARCRDLTNSAVCEKGRANPGSVDLCDWHEVCPLHYAINLL